MNDEQDLLELGKFYFLNKKFKKSVEIFLQFLEEESANYDGMYNLALSYEALNDIDNAKMFYEKTLELKADHKSAQEHLEKIIGKE